jgi:hypothetical protein
MNNFTPKQNGQTIDEIVDYLLAVDVAKIDPRPIAKQAIKVYCTERERDILIWATGGIKEFTAEGKIAIPAKISELQKKSSSQEV